MLGPVSCVVCYLRELQLCLLIGGPRVRGPDTPRRAVHSQHQSVFIQRNEHPQMERLNTQACAFDDGRVLVQTRVQHDDVDRQSPSLLVADGVPTKSKGRSVSKVQS